MTNHKSNVYYNIDIQESNRINIAKVWFTIMVVYIHSYSDKISFLNETINLSEFRWLSTIEYIVSQSISRSAIPAFFMFSAIFTYRKNILWKKNIVNKFKSLMIPYFILISIWILLYFLFQNIPFSSDFFVNSGDIGTWTVRDWIDAYTDFRGNGLILYPLWFLRDLFILNIFSTIFLFVVKKIPNLSLLFFVILWVVSKDTNIIFVNIQGISFWGIGCCLVEKNISIFCFDKFKTKFIGLVYLLMILIDLFSRGNSIYLYWHRLMIFFGIIFWLSLTSKCCNGKIGRIIISVTKYSFPIYLFHENAMSIIKKICVRIFPQNPIMFFVEYIFLPIVVILFCFILCKYMEHKIPKLFKWITGGRC